MAGSASTRLGLDRSSGTTTADHFADVTLRFGDAGHATGVYEAALAITSNDQATPAIEAMVSLTATDPVDAILGNDVEFAEVRPFVQ